MITDEQVEATLTEYTLQRDRVLLENGCGYVLSSKDELEVMRLTLESYEQSKWRPIREAPKDGSTVIFYNKDYNGRKFIDCILPDGQFNKTFNSPLITHWQPLPQSPKESAGE